MKIYIVAEHVPSEGADIVMVTTDYEKACRYVDDNSADYAYGLEIDSWEDGETN